MTAKDKATLKGDSNTTFPSGTGNILASDHRVFNDDVIDSYINTQETADQSMSGNLDMQGNDILNAGNIIQEYDGYETQANILLMNPASFLNETWWATDTKIAFKAVVAVIAGSNVWQQVGVIYNPSTDTYNLPETVDGQVQNVGQELFFKSVNDSSNSATTLNPKIWRSMGSKVGDEEFKLVDVVSAADVTQGDLLGINTTSANIGEKPKMTIIGDINNMNTSLWSVNQPLYIGENGLLTNTLPPVNGIAVAIVTKVHATEGSIFVDTINTTRISIGLTPAGFTRTNFTADTVVLGAGTFYVAEQTTKGSTLLATQVVAVNDNQTIGVTQDHISIAATQNFTFDPEVQQGIVQVSVDSSSAQEQIFVEIYTADNDGNVVDSGSGLPNGDLGVPPIVVMNSAVLDMDAGDSFFQLIAGVSPAPVMISIGQRVRFHTLASKIGTAGGIKDFTFSYGVDAFTFIDSPSAINISMQDTYNVSELITTDSTSEAVKIRRGSTADTDNIIEGQNGAASITFAVTGAGNVSPSGTISSPNYSIPFNGDAVFNTVSGDGSGLTDIAISLQDAYNTGKDILTSPSNGPVDIRVGSGSDGDPILRGFNNAASLTFSLDGEGDVVANSLSAQEITARDTTSDAFDSFIIRNLANGIVITGNGNGTFTAVNFVGSGGAVGGGLTNVVKQVEDNGTPLAQRSKINFLNATSVVDNAGNNSTDVTLPTGGSGIPTLTQYYCRTRTATQTLPDLTPVTLIPNVVITNNPDVGTDFNGATGVLTPTGSNSGIWTIKASGNVSINGTNSPPIMEYRGIKTGAGAGTWLVKRYPYGGNVVGSFGFEIDFKIRVDVGETAYLEVFNITGQTASVQPDGLIYHVSLENK